MKHANIKKCTAAAMILIMMISLMGCSLSRSEASKPKCQYISTAWHSDLEYPQKLIIRGNEALGMYQYVDKALAQALKSYNKDYFKNRILVLITIEASSGGDRFLVTKARKSDDQLTIYIQQAIRGMTCDMAAWYFLIELDRSYDTDAENIVLSIS